MMRFPFLQCIFSACRANWAEKHSGHTWKAAACTLWSAPRCCLDSGWPSLLVKPVPCMILRSLSVQAKAEAAETARERDSLVQQQVADLQEQLAAARVQQVRSTHALAPAT